MYSQRIEAINSYLRGLEKKSLSSHNFYPQTDV